jgi:LacI family transcriptional regulator
VSSGGEVNRVTVKDVADLAGVSTATVSRTFRDPEKVVASTRRRVLDAVDTLGYRPNPMARELRVGGRMEAVGLVIASFTNSFQTGVAAGAERELNRHGMQLIIGTTDTHEEREPDLARGLVDRRVSALMVMPDNDRRDYLHPDRLFGTPVVFVGRPAGEAGGDTVLTDDDRGVAEATRGLIARGHRRIAALAGSIETFRTRQRLAGFEAAMTEAGLEIDPALVLTGIASSSEASAAAAGLFALTRPPSAILGLNLGISTGILLDRIANDRRSAYIALDETEITAGLGITAIVRDPEELGRQAALLAISRIEDPTREARTVVLPTRVVPRGSGEIPA